MDMKSKCHFCAYVGLFPYVMNIQSCKMCNQIYYSSIVWIFFLCVCQSKEIIVVTAELCLSKSGIKLMQVECTFWNQFWTFSLLLFGFAWLRQNIYVWFINFYKPEYLWFFGYFDFRFDHNVLIYSNFFFTISVIVERSEYYSFLLCDLQYLPYEEWHKLKTFREFSEKYNSLSPWNCSTSW